MASAANEGSSDREAGDADHRSQTMKVVLHVKHGRHGQTNGSGEKEARCDPEPEVHAWAATLSQAERKREKYQEMYAADAMTLEELRSKLDALEETRETARRELASLASWCESLHALERDKELLLDSNATRAPEALDSLRPEERRAVYSMLGLRVDALPDKSLRVRGAFGEENLVCHRDRTSTR